MDNPNRNLKKSQDLTPDLQDDSKNKLTSTTAAESGVESSSVEAEGFTFAESVTFPDLKTGRGSFGAQASCWSLNPTNAESVVHAKADKMKTPLEKSYGSAVTKRPRGPVPEHVSQDKVEAKRPKVISMIAENGRHDSEMTDVEEDSETEEFNFDDYYSMAEVEEEPSAQNNLHRNRQPKFATASDLEKIRAGDYDITSSQEDLMGEDSLAEDYDDYYSMAVDDEATSGQNIQQINTVGRTVVDVVMDQALPFCPAKSLIRFKAVSKGWDSWIRSPIFSHRQSVLFRCISGLFCQSATADISFISLNRKAYGMPNPSLSFLPESVEILSSCHGLIYCLGRATRTNYICNPVNKEVKRLAISDSICKSKNPVLAFEPSSENFGADYEIFYPLISAIVPPSLRLYVYSSSKGCCELATEVYYDTEEDYTLMGSGFYLAGRVFWEVGAGRAMVFNIEERLFGIQPLPICSKPGVMMESEGRLGYAYAYKEGNHYIMDLYSGIDMRMKATIFVADQKQLGEECCVLPSLNSEVFFLKIGSTIYSFDHQKQIVQELTDVPSSTVRYIPYINSLVKPSR